MQERSPVQSKYNSGGSEQQVPSGNGSANPAENFQKKSAASKISPENPQYSTPRLNGNEGSLQRSVKSNQKTQPPMPFTEVTGFSVDDQSQYFTMGDVYQPPNLPHSQSQQMNVSRAPERDDRMINRAESAVDLLRINQNPGRVQHKEEAPLGHGSEYMHDPFYRESSHPKQQTSEEPQHTFRGNLLQKFNQGISDVRTQEELQHINRTVPKERQGQILIQRPPKNSHQSENNLPRRPPPTTGYNEPGNTISKTIEDNLQNNGFVSTGKFSDFQGDFRPKRKEPEPPQDEAQQLYSQMYIDSLRELHAAEISSLQNKHTIEKEQLSRQFNQTLREKQNLWQQEIASIKKSTTAESENRRRERELMETISNLKKLNDVLKFDKAAFEKRWEEEEVEREEYKRDVENRIERMKATFYNELNR